MDFTVRHINTIHSSALREQINALGKKKLKNIESPYLKFFLKKGKMAHNNNYKYLYWRLKIRIW